MKIENQVCTLEQAKKLKDLGVAQLSIFSYSCRMNNPLVVCFSIIDMPQQWDRNFAAFTVAELGIMLSTDFLVNDDDTAYISSNQKTSLAHLEEGELLEVDGFEMIFSLPTEAQSRAQLLIKLIEVGLYSVAEINSRLKAA